MVPAALVARVYPGGTMKPGMGDARTALCNVTLKGDEYAAQASFLCRPTDTLAEYQQKAASTRKLALAGIGRSAVGDERNVLFSPGYWTDYKKQMSQARATDVADAAIGFDRTRALGLAADVEKALTPDSARQERSAPR